MSEETQNGQGEDRKPTERVILALVEVIPIPPGATAEQIADAFRALYPKAKPKTSAIASAWLEVARTVAATKRHAIESYAGKAGTSTAKVGTFRAPPVTSWKGAVVHDAPPEPLIQASMID